MFHYSTIILLSPGAGGEMLIHPSELASLIGAVLTFTGVLLTVTQLLRKSGRFNLTLAATLPGLVLVGLGVILLVVGAYTAPVTIP
jgi:hypothetical protein